MLSQDNIANREDLNWQLLDGKLECSVCYGFLYEHDSLRELRGALAFQCNQCQSNLCTLS